jgi:hypothetical protein
MKKMIEPNLLTSAQLDEAIAALSTAAPHLVAVLRAMRDHQIGFAAIEPDKSIFWPKAELQRPSVIMLIDDGPHDPGPAGFHAPSLRRLFRDAGLVNINGAEPHSLVYEAVADQVARERRHAVIVETQGQRVDAWTDAALRAGKAGHDIVRCLVRGQPTAYATANAGDLPTESRPAGQA